MRGFFKNKSDGNVTGLVTRRLLPFLLLLYFFAYLDRINVGFAALQMNHDLGFNSAVYGLGSGIFFAGYFVLEIPSNLMLERVGARLWIFRIMITWGVIACAMALVRSETSFYVLRFLLGIAEAGFFPGIILYLSYWFPSADQARAVALFMLATAVTGAIGSPISGLLLSLAGFGGLRGWQWLFLLEGLPSVILSFVVLAYLPDRPNQAQWLSLDEQRQMAALITAEGTSEHVHRSETLRQVFSDTRIWLLCWIGFTLILGMYGFGFWLPQILKASGNLSNLQIGFIAAIPYVVAGVAMIVVGHHSDRRSERRWHVTGCAGTAAAGFLLSANVHNTVWLVVGLSLAAAGIWSAIGPFWALVRRFLAPRVAAVGIALISSFVNLGGGAGPYIMGLLAQNAHNFHGGLLALAGILLVGGVGVWFIPQETP